MREERLLRLRRLNIIPALLKYLQSPSPLEDLVRHTATQHLPDLYSLFLPSAVTLVAELCCCNHSGSPCGAAMNRPCLVHNRLHCLSLPAAVAPSPRLQCQLGGTCGTHHGSTAIVLDVTLLAMSVWLSSALVRRSPAHTRSTALGCLFLTAQKLCPPALTAIPGLTSANRPSMYTQLAGDFLIWKLIISAMFNTSIKRQIRPTGRENSAVNDGRPEPSRPRQQSIGIIRFLFNLINLINLHRTCGPNLLTPT